MPKQSFQDIVPPERRSITKIPIPERRREAASSPAPESIAPVPPVARVRRPEKKQRGSLKRVFLTLLIVAVVCAGSIWFVLKTSGATITLTLKQETANVDASFTASQNDDSALTFQTASIEKEGELIVPGTTTETTVNTKASGTITIYNKTSASQQLVASTRFATPSGLIFRIGKAVTVPPEKGSTPGSVDAVVTADQAGSNYNVGLTDFTIPGFKGESKYTEFYGRSKTSIGGGASGKQASVDPAIAAAAGQKIQNQLEQALATEVAGNIPQGFVMPLNAYSIKYSPLVSTATSTGVVLSEQATLLGFMFNEQQLAEGIMEEANISDLGNNVQIPHPDDLIFSLTSPTSTATSSITFTLEGSTTLMANIDTDALKQQLVGMPRKSLTAILSDYPGVTKAQAIVEPFWRSSFPGDPSKISIIVTPSVSSQ